MVREISVKTGISCIMEKLRSWFNSAIPYFFSWQLLTCWNVCQMSENLTLHKKNPNNKTSTHFWLNSSLTSLLYKKKSQKNYYIKTEHILILALSTSQWIFFKPKRQPQIAKATQHRSRGESIDLWLLNTFIIFSLQVSMNKFVTKKPLIICIMNA